MSSKGKQKRKTNQPRSNDGIKTGSDEQSTTIEHENESQLEKFDTELTWCIEQLQLGLESQNPNSKQAMEATKILKILLSAKAPLIKKRQAMRNAFGDYRKKMAEMEKKSLIALRKSTVAPVQSSTLQKSKFFKRSTFSTKDNTDSHVLDNISSNINQSCAGGENSCENQLTSEPSGKQVSDLSSNFQFGFKIDSESCAAETGVSSSSSSCDTAGNSSSATKDLNSETPGIFYKSDNSFRFGFSVTE